MSWISKGKSKLLNRWRRIDNNPLFAVHSIEHNHTYAQARIIVEAFTKHSHTPTRDIAINV